MLQFSSKLARRRATGQFLRSGASLAALCIMSSAVPALAQDAPAGGEDEIIVSGIRASLESAQNIKRSADTVVDAITAEDIGALPDRSVTEALSRIPGVAMNRFAGSNDPDHFSVEGSGVVVRGLTYVRSEFNGRDAFSPGVYGQAIGFQDVPADMLGSVEVWKNSTAEMTEGGLSGTVNMNLRRPFDKNGFFLGFSAEGVLTDMREKWSPVGSVVVSNTWDTGIGRIGLLGAASYSKLYSRADGVQVSNFQTRDGIYARQSNTADTAVCRNQLPSGADSQGFPPNLAANGLGSPCVGTAPNGANGFSDLLSEAHAPLGGQFRTQEFDRTRKGFAAAAQWESLDRRAQFSAQYLHSDSRNKWGEYTFEAGSDLSEYNTYPIGCRPNAGAPGGGPRAECPVGPNSNFENYEYGDDNIFDSGYITLPVGGWRGNIGYVGDRVAHGGMQHTLTRRQVKESNVVNDLGFNFKFAPTDRWAFNVDAQHVWAKRNNLDFSVTGSNYADQELDLTGNYPRVIPHKPQQLGLWATWSQNSAVSPALQNASDEEYFGNKRYTFWRSAMDHLEESTGEEWAIKGDVQYNFSEDSYLKHVKFGARYADRDQTVRYTTYNWGSLSETWAGRAIHMDEVGADQTALHDWGNFFRGNTIAPPTANFYTGDLVDDYEKAVTLFRQVQAAAILINGTNAQGQPNFTPSWNPLASRANVIPGTSYLPSEIQPVSETNKSAYVMLSFGRGEPVLGGVSLDGNIGVRWVQTKVKSTGSIGAPTQQAIGVDVPFAINCAPQLPQPPAPQIPQIPEGVCELGETVYNQLRAYATGQTTADTAINEYDYFLPSLNLKFGLADNLIARFAISRNLARASMADIRNFLTTGLNADTGQLEATAGNPYLKPAISDNLDLSLEWYFAGNGVGSLNFNFFAKNIHNFFYQQITTRPTAGGGQSLDVYVRGPANFDGIGKVRGFEVSYTQVYDFLPGVLSGLGLSANYTYIDSSGLPNSMLNGGVPVNQSPIGIAGNLPLEQLSKHNINIQPFFEKGPVSLRVAYNWRSKFLLTASDVIFPYFPIFNEATGTVDATLFLKINDKFKVGVQGVNLTNEVTRTTQQFTLDGLQGPRSYFMNDRRFHFILRGSF